MPMKNRPTSSASDGAENDSTPATTPPGHPQRRGPMDAARSLAGEIVVVIVCVVFWLETSEFEQPDAGGLGPTFVPRLLIILLVICVMVRICQTFWSRPADEQHADDDYPISKRHLVQGIALSVGYVLAVMYVGYPLATFLLVLSFIWTASKFTWTAAVLAFGVALALPYLFVRVVFIDLPRGVGVFDEFTIWLYGLLGIY